jgi:hypothetical protein
MKRSVIALALMALMATWAGCGFPFVPYEYDPEELEAVAAETEGLEGEELFEAVRSNLQANGHTLPAELDWTLNQNQGVQGQLAVLYQTPWEFLVIAGSPTTTEWTMGPVASMDIWDIVIQGEMSCFREGDFAAETLSVADSIFLEQGDQMTCRFDDGGWVLEYGRGYLSGDSPLYAQAFRPDSSVQLVAGLTNSIVDEFIQSLIYQILNVDPLFSSFGGF